MTDKKKNIDYKKIMETLSKNYWAVSTIVLAVLLVVVLISGGISGATIGADTAGQSVLDFANKQGANAELLSVADDGALYEVILSIEGQEVPVYVTKDGKSLVPSLIPLTAEVTQTPTPTNTQTAPAPTAYSEEDLTKLKTFNDCLGESGLKIYGANWCGWTKKLVVDTLGGFKIASGAYIECTEETELCSSEGVTGYPTVKLNGEAYQGERTIEALSQETGCPAPTLTGAAPVADSTVADCGA